MWQERTLSLDLSLTKPVGRGKKRRERKEKEKRVKLYLISNFFDDRTFGFHRSKRESSSSWQELQVKTRIGEFRQTPRGRSLSPTWFNSRLKAIQMVLVFWGRKWPCIPVPKI